MSNAPQQTKRSTSALIGAIFFTIIALLSYNYIPEKHLLIAPAPAAIFDIFSSQLADGTASGAWLNKTQLSYRCKYPPGFSDNDYYCSINRNFAFSETKGIDLSSFDRLKIKINYTGSAPKLRLFARTYDPSFSKPNDSNSTKYNAIFLPTSDLAHEITIKLNEFTVTEWWLLQYKISRQHAQPDLSNVVVMGVDFSYPMTEGDHDVTIDKIEFIGERISKENWYLMLFSFWLAGIFIYALKQLHTLKLQTKNDHEIIDTLHSDNQKLKIETSKFRRLSTVDPLTQLFNRFGIDQIVTSLTTRPSTEDNQYVNRQLALILIDIDHFKVINDTHGHDVGDIALKATAELIRSNALEKEFIGRWGGEEFLIVLPEISLEETYKLAEQLRIKIFEYSITIEKDTHIQITASFGIGQCTDGDFPSAFKRVDTALYHAKHSGRNRVSVATETSTSN
jgi:diguanylate cyclase (GGDEF)-like protein